MKCDVCKTILNAANIGYVKTSDDNKKIFECKKCHSNKRRENKRKLSTSWMFVA